MAMPRARGRERRVPGEATKRIKISFSESEIELLKIVVHLNQYASIAEFVRDAVNGAADDCGAKRPCVERRARERRRQAADVDADRRRTDRRRIS